MGDGTEIFGVACIDLNLRSSIAAWHSTSAGPQHRVPSLAVAPRHVLSLVPSTASRSATTHAMPPKRLRRASPTQSGLNAGERLKRTKLTDSKVYSAWGWVSTEVTDVSHITPQHRLATCGFSDNSPFPICPNRFAASNASSPVKSRQSSGGAGVEADDDVIVISDDESSKCSLKACKSNPYCLNYLGQEKWEDEGESAVQRLCFGS